MRKKDNRSSGQRKHRQKHTGNNALTFSFMVPYKEITSHLSQQLSDKITIENCTLHNMIKLCKEEIEAIYRNKAKEYFSQLSDNATLVNEYVDTLISSKEFQGVADMTIKKVTPVLVDMSMSEKFKESLLHMSKLHNFLTVQQAERNELIARRDKVEELKGSITKATELLKSITDPSSISQEQSVKMGTLEDLQNITTESSKLLQSVITPHPKYDIPLPPKKTYDDLNHSMNALKEMLSSVLSNVKQNK